VLVSAALPIDTGPAPGCGSTAGTPAPCTGLLKVAPESTQRPAIELSAMVVGRLSGPVHAVTPPPVSIVELNRLLNSPAFNASQIVRSS
jgi:hypothetical protein